MRVEVGEHVNVYLAESIGTTIINGMAGQSILRYKFKRSMAAVTMNMVVVKSGNDSIVVDPDKMFYMLLTSALFRWTKP